MDSSESQNNVELPCSTPGRHLFPVMYSRIISEDEAAPKEQKISAEMQEVARALFYKVPELRYSEK